LSTLTEEGKRLRHVLECLEQLSKETESAIPGTETRLPQLRKLCEPEGLLTMCLAELESLRKKLTQPKWAGETGSRRTAIIQALGWPLKEKETQKIVRSIQNIKSTLSLAATVDQT
jgi:hypothetical protein